MRRLILVLVCTFSLVLSVTAQDETCIAGIGSRIQAGALVSPVTDAEITRTPDGEWVGNFVTTDRNAYVLEGPACVDGVRYWRIVYGVYSGWVQEQALTVGLSQAPYMEVTRAASNTSVRLAGLMFTMPASLGETVSAQVITSVPENAFRAPDFATFRTIGFPDAASHRSFYFGTPAIYVYRVADMEGFSMDGTNRSLLEDLREAIARGTHDPAREDYFYSIPSTNAAEVIRGDFTRIDFGNGEGIRYLTFYSQSVVPVGSELIYTYQGLSADGQWFVAAKFPVRVDYSSVEYVPSLPSMDLPNEEFNQAYSQSLREGEAALRTLPDGAFTPNLAVLDGLMQSFFVEAQPETLPYITYRCAYMNFGSTAPASYLRPGEMARRTPGSSSILRADATTSASEVARIPENAVVRVDAFEPVCNENYAWWFVTLDNGQSGWVAEGDPSGYFFEPVLN